MKTILVIIALTGFTAVGSYAQHTDCYSKPKTVVTKKVSKEKIPTCFMLKNENFGIPGCVNVTYNHDDDYPGYYLPKTNVVNKPTITDKVAATAKPVIPPIRVHYTIPVTDEIAPPCYTYTQHNIVVKACPGVFYDNNARIINNNAGMPEYNSENTYMGNYPEKKKDDIKDPNKPENKEIEGTTFPGDDLYFWDSYKK